MPLFSVQRTAQLRILGRMGQEWAGAELGEKVAGYGDRNGMSCIYQAQNCG
jgi:hypothetical protein